MAGPGLFPHVDDIQRDMFFFYPGKARVFNLYLATYFVEVLL